MAISIIYPKIEELLSPLLASIPAGVVSSEPPTALLPMLTPILRQRVQFLSSSTSDPWLPLLSYDGTKESVFKSIATSKLLELHPVSGQVEIDWESETDARFNRVDCETFQALVIIRQLNLSIKLLWCTNDSVGFNSCDGWRIGEVRPCNTDDYTWGVDSIFLAEKLFISKQCLNTGNLDQSKINVSLATSENEVDKEDDQYWARYDCAASQTPPPRNFPVSPVASSGSKNLNEDDDFYSQYDMVQPAIDNHCPEEAVDSSLYESKVIPKQSIEGTKINDDNIFSLRPNGKEIWNDESVDCSILYTHDLMQHQGPDFQVSSNVSQIATKLEQQVSSESLSKTAIKTHIETSLKGLYHLARTTGIGRGEFDRIVRVQLESLITMNGEGVDF